MTGLGLPSDFVRKGLLSLRSGHLREPAASTAAAASIRVCSAIPGQSHHQLDRLVVGEALPPNQQPPGIEAERERQRGLQQRFVGARLAHAVAYATKQSHEIRATLFTTGSVAVMVMAAYVLVAAAF